MKEWLPALAVVLALAVVSQWDSRLAIGIALTVLAGLVWFFWLRG